ncbi:MAG: hypothetical protein KBT28_09680 [Bacteroidales bacterium]|nr:hypothetical protein [Candidatus Colimorpha merdihippi]
MKKILLLTFAALLLASCGNKVILDQSSQFKDDIWLRFQPESFSASVKNIDDCYNFTVTLDVDTSRYHEAGLPLMIEVKSPEGETRTIFSTILLRNHEGNILGEFVDGHLRVSQMVRQFYFFNIPGEHTISLSQRTSKYEIRGIHNLNFRIEKAKLVYPE